MGNPRFIALFQQRIIAVDTESKGLQPECIDRDSGKGVGGRGRGGGRLPRSHPLWYGMVGASMMNSYAIEK